MTAMAIDPQDFTPLELRAYALAYERVLAYTDGDDATAAKAGREAVEQQRTNNRLLLNARAVGE
jgi:predicted DNA-binding transcriptional regulator YafY